MMKRIFFWIVTVITVFGILPASAQDENNVQFTINVPNPEAVSCQMNGQPYELVKGANAFDVPQYTNFYFEGVAPWKITGVTDKNGSTAPGFYGDTWYLTAYPEIQDMEYTFVLTNLDEFRTAQFTLNIDDPSLVYAVLGGYFTTLDLKEGTNIVKYDPAKETYITISPVAYDIPLYSVKIDGTEVAPIYNSYNIELTEDCVVDVVAVLPDEDHVVNFTYSEGAEGSISISINGQESADFDGKSIIVKLGDRLTISGNSQEYKYEEVKINDNSVPFESTSYTFPVMKDSEVFVNAHPYGSIKATIVIPDTRLVTIYKGYTYEEPLPMQQGENIIELPENNSIVSWLFSEMAILNAITLNGETVSSYYSNLTLKEGDVLAFDVTEKVFDKKAVVWIDNVAGKACSIYMNMSSTTDHSVRYTFENGYNMIDFYEQMNPFTLGWYGTSEEIPNVSLTGKAYLNGTLLEPQYEGSTTFGFDLADNDVLKLFMDTDPVECKVAFDVADGVEADVVKDIVTVVENPADGFDCFAGTQVTVTGKNLVVAVNKTELEAENNEDGTSTYTFVVTETDNEVAISGKGSAVAGINAESDAYIYNLQGVKVGKKSELKSMLPGIYIINGKKTVVR